MLQAERQLAFVWHCNHDCCDLAPVDVQVAETAAGVFPGIAIDDLHLSEQATAAFLAGNAAVMTAIWLLVYLWYFKRGDDKKASYEPLDQQELGDLSGNGSLEKPSQQD